MIITKYLLIGLGGGLGAMSRAAVSSMLPATVLTSFPFQILVVNIIGCFAMGFATEAFEEIFSTPGHHINIFIATGFLGGFTTFSTFALEFGQLVEKNMMGTAMLHVVISVTTGIAALFMGIKLAKILFS